MPAEKHFKNQHWITNGDDLVWIFSCLHSISSRQLWWIQKVGHWFGQLREWLRKLQRLDKAPEASQTVFWWIDFWRCYRNDHTVHCTMAIHRGDILCHYWFTTSCITKTKKCIHDAACDRSFSALKRIKNYHRYIIEQERVWTTMFLGSDGDGIRCFEVAWFWRRGYRVCSFSLKKII